MALTNNRYDLSELAKVDENGFQAALFPQIKDAYVKRLQEIYGYDIDVSSGSADGQYVMAESLVLNNVYRVLESLSDNLTPASASGKYLDVLASLSGAFRRQATYSTATVLVKNTGTTDTTPSYLLFMDKNGNRWQWINPKDINGGLKVTFKAGAVTAITVTCTELGAVAALGGKTEANAALWAKDPLERGGDIYATTTASTLQVYQKDDAITGQNTEDDSSLRSRRLKSLGQSGKTVIDTLIANLLNVPGVIDVWAYSNNTNAESAPVADNTVVPAHSVYICVATQHGVTVPDYSIADTIYGCMTPGIPTYVGTGILYPNAQPGAINFVTGTPKTVDIPVTDAVSNTVSWKLCSELTPAISIVLDLKNGTSVLSEAQKQATVDAAITYLNGIELGSKINGSVLEQVVEGADFKTGRYGLPTYDVIALTAGEVGTDERSLFGTQLTVPLVKLYYQPSDAKWTVRTEAPYKGKLVLQLGLGTFPEVD